MPTSIHRPLIDDTRRSRLTPLPSEPSPPSTDRSILPAEYRLRGSSYPTSGSTMLEIALPLRFLGIPT